ncbi:putative ankyrin repeat protein L25 [Colletotrichum tropicale]|nr:putative ankyrin repeat protein L25 [Colletotrichum tropicale]
MILLISKGADVNSNSPIQTAVRSGHAEVVRALVEGGADFNAKDEEGSNPLLEAAGRGYEGVVRILVDNGSDLHVTDKTGSSPLLRAARGGYEEVIRVLIKSGAVINKLGDDVDGLLHEAAKGGHASDGHSPLHSAARHGHQVVVRILIENGSDVHASDIYKSIALEEASQKGHLEIVEFLLGPGARIHGEKGNPRGFVNSISLSKNEDIHKLLIEKGLCLGSEKGDVWEVEQHLGYVADIDPDGSSVWYNEAVRVATEKGHKQIIRLFQLRRLSQASARGHINILRALLDEGVSVVARDTVGCCESALEAATFGNHRDVVELLLENGACVKQDNKWLIGYLQRFYDIRESKAIT